MSIHDKKAVPVVNQNTTVNTNPVHTGPKTEAGKKASSKNAQKAAIFTKGYLPWEDVATKQAQMEVMARQWGADDPTRQLILRTIEQAQLGLERLMAADKLRIEGIMQSLHIKHEFAKQAGIDPVIGLSLPSWFFKDDDEGQKKQAQFILQVFDDALQLQDQFSDQIVAKIAEKFPSLYEYIMGNIRSGQSFLIVMGQRYKQQTALLNVIALVNEIKTQYKDHLLWASRWQSYQVIIDGIRAQQVLEVMDLDRTNRYATSFQNRILKGLQALDTMNKIESAHALSPAVGQVMISSAMLSPANGSASSRRDLADPDEAMVA